MTTYADSAREIKFSRRKWYSSQPWSDRKKREQWAREQTGLKFRDRVMLTRLAGSADGLCYVAAPLWRLGNRAGFHSQAQAMKSLYRLQCAKLIVLMGECDQGDLIQVRLPR